MEVKIIKLRDQANGQFDGGKIKELKPIGFSGEGSLIDRLGPLFYWAWGHSQAPAEIGLHPHQGFKSSLMQSRVKRIIVIRSVQKVF